MRILVLSDTHGNMDDEFIKKIKYEEKFDMLIHCGDCCKDLDYIIKNIGIQNYVNVNGNCDFNKEAEDIEIIELVGKKILITHGHLFGVKRNLDNLTQFAEEKNVDVVVFGHTHKFFSKYINNILYFNPGSACLPTFGEYSYGILTIENGQVFDEIVEW